MATRTISTRLAVEGESEYRSAITRINTELTTMNTNLKLVESEFTNHQNSMQALQAKSDALAQKQQVLSEKVKTCKDAYENARSALTNYQSKVETLSTALATNKEAVSGLSAETKTAGTQWNEYKEKLDAAKTRLEELKKTTDATSQEEAELKSQLAALRETTGDTSEEEAKLEARLAELQETSDAAGKEQAELESQISSTQAAMQKLNEETDGAAEQAGDLLAEQERLTSELEEAQAGETAAAKACEQWTQSANRAQIQLNKTNAEIEQNDQYLSEAAKSADGCATSIDQFGKKATTAGTDATAAMSTFATLLTTGIIAKAIREIVDALEECISACADFESQMSTVEAISGATAEEMELLTEAAKEMGSTTTFTATEAGEALEYMAMAGWDTEEMLDGLSGIMDLAAASGEDLGTTSDIVTDALTAFGLAASDSAHFADVLAEASASSNTTVSLLGESFQQVGTTAGALGYSIEDVSVALGVMANQGLKGSTSGTALATALTRMSGANETATQAMEELDLSMYNLDGTAKDLSDFLGELREAFADMTDEQKENYAYLLAGQKGMKGLLAIVNTADEDWDDLTASIANCNDASAEMAETKLDNYAGQVTLLESAMEGLEISIGEVLTPALGNLVEVLTSMVNGISNFIDDVPMAAAVITGLLVSLAAFAASMLIATKGVTGLHTAMKALNATMAANPIGLVVSALAALAVGITTVVGVMSSYNSAQDTAINEAKELAAAISETVDAYEESKESIETSATNTKKLVNRLSELISKTDRTTSEQETLLYIIDELNEAIPDLNLAYDEETDSINMTTEAVERLAEAQTADDEYAAAVENMTTLYGYMTEAEEDLAEAQAQRAIAEESLAAIRQTLIDAGYASEVVNTEEYKTVQNLTEQEEILTAALEDATAAYEDACAAVDSYGEATDESTDLTATAEDAAESLAEEITSLQTAYDEAYDSAYESLSGQMELWDEVDKITAMSTETIMAALDSQLAYWTDYDANLQNVYSRNIEGLDELVASIDDGSSEAATYIAGLAAMTDDELQAMVDKYGEVESAMSGVADTTATMGEDINETLQQLVDDTAAALNDMDLSQEAKEAAVATLEGYMSGIDTESDEVDDEIVAVAQEWIDRFRDELGISGSSSTTFSELGENSMQGYLDGITGQIPSVEDGLTLAMQSGVDAAKEALDSHSPSKEYETLGSDSIQGYINGSNGKMNALTSALKSLAQSAISAFKQNSTSSSLSSTGTETIQGYISGVGDKLTAATAKMRSIAENAISAYTSNSTGSSLYSAGTNTIQGFIDGINNKASSLYSKMQSIASSALSAFKKKLGINSPSIYMEEAGEFTDEGFINGVVAKQREVDKAMSDMAKSASTSFEDGLDVDMDDLDASVQSAYSLSTDASGTSMRAMLEELLSRVAKLAGSTINQTNNYYVPTATPSEVSREQKKAAKALLGGVT